MVLIDADFDRAYLTEEWRRHFLIEPFRSFIFMLNHNDTIMRYRAQALRREFWKRFVHMDNPDGDHRSIVQFFAMICISQQSHKLIGA